jgi:hypothetical protein
VNLEHLILKVPNEYLRRINFQLMNHLQTLEITTELNQHSVENQYDPSFSELSGGNSLGMDVDCNNCSKGIDYSLLQLPNHTLKHLKIIYQVIHNKNVLHLNTGGSIYSSRTKPALYQSLIPGFDHSDQNSFSPCIVPSNLEKNLSESTLNQTQQTWNKQIQMIKTLPKIKNITIFVEEISKIIDQSSFMRQ